MVDQTSQFYAILTNVGAAKQANADALGIARKITQMGVGDAKGTDPTPNATQTSLINEWRRAPLNQLKVDDKNSAIIIAEQVIPADVGGKWIREIALYDADGDMVAVANCAPTYKPLLSGRDVPGGADEPGGQQRQQCATEDRPGGGAGDSGVGYRGTGQAGLQAFGAGGDYGEHCPDRVANG